ncbi:hypothetical protein ACHAXR_010724 [Thalassiosira sp. AJA248-18]
MFKIVAIVWLFTLLDGAHPSNIDQEKDVISAVATLNAFDIRGLDGLCHYESMELIPIPRCQGANLGSDSQPQQLRKRNLLKNLTDANNGIQQDENSVKFYLTNIGGAIFSVLVVVVISAMFLGFLTLDPLDLRVKMRAAIDPIEREAAVAVFQLVSQSHRLLVTLLLMNALAYECLPLFLDKLMPTYLTILFSVTLLLIFGELIPSAIFTGPDQLLLASKLAPAVSVSMTVFHPVTYPLVKLLDWLVPPASDEEEYNRAELSALVRIQYEERMNEVQRQHDLMMPRSHVRHMANQINAEKQRRQQPDNDFNSNRSWKRHKEEIMYAVDERRTSSQEQGFFDGLIGGIENGAEENTDTTVGGLQSLLTRTPSSSSVSSATPFEQIAPPMERSEVKAVEGALKLKTGCAFDVYTPLRMIYAVSEDMILTKQSIADIYGQGYSRVPVYEMQPPPNENRISAVKGILMTRQLIMVNWDDERTVSSMPLYIPPCVSPRMNLVTLLSLLRKGGSLVALVCAGPHIAKKALREGRAIPIEAGFMGLVTLENVLESVLQERIFDEEDIAERNLASAVLTRWAANKIKQFMTQKIRPVHKNATSNHAYNEESPLMEK